MLEPIYHIEFFLDAIVNNTTPPEPIYRAEFYLAKIAGSDVEIPEPVYRMEKYLAYLCGEEVELPDPIYRIEYYLAFLCGLNVELPEPIYRVEFWLWDWCGGGGIEKTVTGNPIHILDALAKPAQALSVKLEPIQDLHGYDNPWPAGGGKNKWNPKLYSGGSYNPTVGTTWNLTESSVQFTESSPGVFTLTTSATWRYFTMIIPCAGIDKARLSYQFSSTGQGGRSWGYLDENFKVLSAINSTDAAATYNAEWNPSSIENAAYAYVLLTNRGTASATLTLTNPQFEIGTTTTPYAPYSNICPISGHSSVNVIVSPTLNPLDGTITNIPLGGTCYGGQLDVLPGVLMDTNANIASYNGETVNEPWISSMDAYSPGATPTIGAQVVYPLSTPQTIQLTPTQVELLLGENNLFSDGTMTLVYLADGNASDVEALNILLGGRYTNTHGADEPTDREALNIILGGNER